MVQRVTIVVMRLWVLALLIGWVGCWTSSEKPVNEPEWSTSEEQDRPVVVAPEEPAEPTCSAQTFDPSNRACEDICVQTAPQGWPGCAAAAQRLVARGFTCTRPTPFACTRPQVVCPIARCVRFFTRIIGISIVANGVEVAIAGGSDRGVALGWSASLVDKNDQPVPNAAITLTRVDTKVSRGSLSMTPDQIKALGARVVLSP
jgi:hypothetical protein